MGDTTTKFITFAFSLLITCMVLSISYTFFLKSKPVLQIGDKHLQEMQSSMLRNKLDEYSDSSSRGSNVVGAIRKYASDDFAIIVDNSAKGGTVTCYTAIKTLSTTTCNFSTPILPDKTSKITLSNISNVTDMYRGNLDTGGGDIIPSDNYSSYIGYTTNLSPNCIYFRAK